jgi:kynurenine formamidase
MAAAAVACGARAASGAAMATPAPQQPRSFTTVLDLTHTLYEGFPTFDGSKWFTKEKKFTFATDKLNINTWTVVEHTGTHMDAPLHFTADGHSVDEIPITDFVVPLAVVDISQRAQENPDTALTPDDIQRWEATNGPLPEGCCVMMNSGWHRFLDSPRFTGHDDAGKNHCPGFHGETAHMLLTERNVKGIGVDTLSQTPAWKPGAANFRCISHGLGAAAGVSKPLLISMLCPPREPFWYWAVRRSKVVPGGQAGS